MLEFTQSAVDSLQRMLDQANTPETHSLRLVHGQKGYAILPDEIRSDDVAILQDENERPLMITDPPIAEILDGRTIDYVATTSEFKVT